MPEASNSNVHGHIHGWWNVNFCNTGVVEERQIYSTSYPVNSACAFVKRNKGSTLKDILKHNVLMFPKRFLLGTACYIYKIQLIKNLLFWNVL